MASSRALSSGVSMVSAPFEPCRAHLLWCNVFLARIWFEPSNGLQCPKPSAARLLHFGEDVRKRRLAHADDLLICRVHVHRVEARDMRSFRHPLACKAFKFLRSDVAL